MSALNDGKTTGSLSRRRFGWLLLLALAAMTFGLDRMPLLDPDEGRNASVAREMAAAGDWLLPHYNGLPYLDKPVLYFAAVAASLKAFGPTEAAARLPSVAFALGALILTYHLARRRYDAERARWAVLILATAPLFVGFARIVIFDMALVFFTLAGWSAAEAGRHGARWGYPAAWALAALGVLTKGPVALLLFLIGSLLLPLGNPPRASVRRFFHPLHLALFAALLAPWVWAVEQRQPGFLRYALLVETAERLTRPTFHRTGPPWYYLPVLILGFLPWSLPWLANPVARLAEAWRNVRLAGPERGPLLATGAIVAFFSLSSSKLGGYILPVFPLLALLAAGSMSDPHGERRLSRGTDFLLLGIGIILIGATLLPISLERLLRQPAALASDLKQLFRGLGLLLAASGGAIWGARAVGRPGWAPLVLALVLPGFVGVGFRPLMGYAEVNSARRLAQEIEKPAGHPGDFVAVRCFKPGLPFYLRRSIPLVSDTGSELTSTFVARNFDALRRAGSSVLWTQAELDSALAAGAVHGVLTRLRAAAPNGFRPAGDFQRVRLWTREM